MKTGPRNSLSAPHQVHKVDSFQNCGGEGIFLATPVGGLPEKAPPLYREQRGLVKKKIWYSNHNEVTRGQKTTFDDWIP